MNNRHMSLMLLATLKIVSCLKNYCCHNDDNTHIVNLLHLPRLLQNMFYMSLDINYNWGLTYFSNQLQITSTQMNINKKWNYMETLADKSTSIYLLL